MSRWCVILIAVLLAGLGVLGWLYYDCQQQQCDSNPAFGDGPAPVEDVSGLSGSEKATVVRVHDGDTIVLADGRFVRLLGVDAPEGNQGEVPLQRFADEARDFLRSAAEGRVVELQFDRVRTDHQGRTLAYVHVGEALLNKEVLRAGFGFVRAPFPFVRRDEFMEAEREARGRQLGLWNYTLSDGRLTNLSRRYDQLSPDGKAELEKFWDELVQRETPPAGAGTGIRVLGR